MKKTQMPLHHYLAMGVRTIFWFSVGALLGFFFFVSFLFIFFQQQYSTTIYPGVTINGVPVGGKTEEEVSLYFAKKNREIGSVQITFHSEHYEASIEADDLDVGYNGSLLAQQAKTIGRSPDIISNMSTIFQAYLYGINLPVSYSYSQSKLLHFLDPFIQKEKVAPIDALFTFENGKVSAFRPSVTGKDVDVSSVEHALQAKTTYLLANPMVKHLSIEVPVRAVAPRVTTESANKWGIKELIGSGTSLYQHSIPSRAFNVSLAASKINGVLIAPDEVFSFDHALGDISAYTGYQQAYVIQNGKTVLGDGGGVCQVSTTFFRALLDAGLPIVERHAHAYRVGYYEQDSPPGIDATIFYPSVDLKFKNDTGNYILVQTAIDPSINRLTFYLYGKKDGREVHMTKPVITAQIPAPAAVYQDDPTLPVGTIQQVDFSADGATVSFSRTVRKGDKALYDDTFVSNYRPWQAVFLRGTRT